MTVLSHKESEESKLEPAATSEPALEPTPSSNEELHRDGVGPRCRPAIAFQMLRQRWSRRAPIANDWLSRITKIFMWLRGFCPRRCGRIFMPSMRIAASQTILATRSAIRQLRWRCLTSGERNWMPVTEACAPSVFLLHWVRRFVQCGIPKEPFADLLSAFRQDQTVTRYATMEDVLGYCRYSANPVGRLVL